MKLSRMAGTNGVSGQPDDVEARNGYAAMGMFVVALLVNCYYVFQNAGNNLLDAAAFRQTQTALSTYYLVKDGLKVAYETPVVGAPWSIPFEFPLYEWVVAIMKDLMPEASLDMLGRMVSLAFFYAGIYFLYRIMRELVDSRWQSLVLLSLVLLHPVYIFWSRAFLIESTALFLSLFYVFYAIRYLRHGRVLTLLAAVAGALLAAMVKVTTVVPFCALVAGLTLYDWQLHRKRLQEAPMRRYMAVAAGLLAAPLVAAVMWVGYTDALKSLNAYAYEFTASAKLSTWNYGTVEQKLSGATWIRILENSQLYRPWLGVLLCVVLGVLFVGKYRYRWHALLCLMLYFLPPMIFTNLYMAHEYYAYANSVFLCLCFGFVALTWMEATNGVVRVSGWAIAAMLLVFFHAQYRERYYKMQLFTPTYLLRSAQMVKQYTEPDDVVLVYGIDWSSEYAYYSERRCIGIRNVFKSVNDPVFRAMIAENKYGIKALVVTTRRDLADREFGTQLIDYMGFKPVARGNDFIIFRKQR